MYINDDFFSKKKNSFLDIGYDPKLDIIFEDENLMLIDKNPVYLFMKMRLKKEIP